MLYPDDEREDFDDDIPAMDDGDDDQEDEEETPPTTPGGTRMQRLDCKLTDEEIAKTAREMAALELEIEQTEGHKKAAVKQYSDELKEMRARARELARGVREGVIKRDVEVRDEVHNLNMVTVRLDTGETIDSRPMTDAERQLVFAGMTAPEKAAAMPGADAPDAPPERPHLTESMLRDRILEVLKTYPEGVTAFTVGKTVGCAATEARDVLDDLVDEGHARTLPKGRGASRWAPAEKADPVVEEAAKVEELRMRNRVLEYLRPYPEGATPATVAKAIGCPEGEAKHQLEALEEAGQLRKVGRKWAPVEPVLPNDAAQGGQS